VPPHSLVAAQLIAAPSSGLCTFLWINGQKLISGSLSGNNSMGCVLGLRCGANGQLHQKRALTIFD
ncbi:MAG: hypothetical protein ACLQFM_11150, partial [Terriglobales bacterium]